MKAAGLKPTDPIVEPSPILINSRSPGNPDLVDLVAAQVRGAMTARKFVSCQYDVERTDLPAPILIAAGKHASMVIPFDEEGWIAVSVMVEKEKMASTVDELTKAGATDLIVLGIANTCRENIIIKSAFASDHIYEHLIQDKAVHECFWSLWCLKKISSI